METFQIRTDLALEARESVNEEESKLRGVSVDASSMVTIPI